MSGPWPYAQLPLLRRRCRGGPAASSFPVSRTRPASFHRARTALWEAHQAGRAWPCRGRRAGPATRTCRWIACGGSRSGWHGRWCGRRGRPGGPPRRTRATARSRAATRRATSPGSGRRRLGAAAGRARGPPTTSVAWAGRRRRAGRAWQRQPRVSSTPTAMRRASWSSSCCSGRARPARSSYGGCRARRRPPPRTTRRAASLAAAASRRPRGGCRPWRGSEKGNGSIGALSREEGEWFCR